MSLIRVILLPCLIARVFHAHHIQRGRVESLPSRSRDDFFLHDIYKLPATHRRVLGAKSRERAEIGRAWRSDELRATGAPSIFGVHKFILFAKDGNARQFCECLATLAHHLRADLYEPLEVASRLSEQLITYVIIRLMRESPITMFPNAV